MKEAFSLCSNLFILFFSNLNREINNFFENNGEGPLKAPKQKKELYKIPRLGR